MFKINYIYSYEFPLANEKYVCKSKIRLIYLKRINIFMFYIANFEFIYIRKRDRDVFFFFIYASKLFKNIKFILN